MKKFFQIAASELAVNLIPFTFAGSYITSRPFDVTADVNDEKKVWINKGDSWLSFVDPKEFKEWIRNEIKK